MKPIAGPNIMPFGLGGFCVSGANIGGVLYSKLNIYQQRSSVMFDLIDGNGVVHDFIELVHVDANKQLLDPTKTTTELQSLIAPNTFFIQTKVPETQEPVFVYQYQSNLIKLSNGDVSFKPWEYINFCNAVDDNQINNVDALKSTLTAEPTAIPADGETKTLVTLTVRDSSGAILTAIDSGVVFSATGMSSDVYQISAVDYSQKASGIITVTVMGVEAGTLTISAQVGSVSISQTAQVAFTGSGLHVIDPASSTITATSPVIANFASTSLITITLKDSYGNPVTDVQTFVNLTLSGFADASDYEWGTMDFTNKANGIYTVTLKSKKALTTNVTAVIRGITLAQQPEIVFSLSNAPSPGGITLTSSKRTVNISNTSPSSAASTTTLTLTVKDQYGNPVNNLTSNVTLGITNAFDTSRYTISPIDLTNASTGVYSFTVYSREAADVQFYPIIPALGSLPTITAAVDFMWRGSHGEIGTPVESQSLTQVPDDPIIADNLHDAEVIIFLGSINHKICNNVTATGTNKLSITPRTGTTIGALDYSWAGVGMITCRVKASYPGDYNFIVYSNGVAVTGFSLKFILGPVNGEKTTFTASPLTAKIDGTGNETLSTFTIAKKDFIGNAIPITAEEISISATGFNSTSDYTISNWSINGNVANATVTSKMAVTGTFTATLGSTVIAQKPSVKWYWDDLSGNTGPVDGTQIDLFGSPNTIKDDNVTPAYISSWLYSAGKVPTAGIMASSIEYFVVSPTLAPSEYTITPPVDTAESYARGGKFRGSFTCKKGGISVVIGMKYNGVVMPKQVTIHVEKSVVISPTQSTLFATSSIDNQGVGRFADIVCYPRTADGKSVKTLTEGSVEFKCTDPSAVFTYDYSQADQGVIRGTMECPNVGFVDVTAVISSENVGPAKVQIRDWTIPDADCSFISGPTEPVLTMSPNIVTLTLKDFNGFPVILDSGVEFDVSSVSNSGIIADPTNYTRKNEGIYTTSITTGAEQDVFVRATAAGKLLHAQYSLKFVNSSPAQAVSVTLAPRDLAAQTNTTFEVNAVFGGVNADNVATTGTWTISDPHSVQIISNDGAKFKATALNTGTYTIKFVPDADPTRPVSTTLSIVAPNTFASAKFGFTITKNTPPVKGMVLDNAEAGVLVNSNSEAVFSVNYLPAEYVPTTPVTISARKYPNTGAVGTPTPSALPFTFLGTPDNLNYYVRFDKGVYGAYSITVMAGDYSRNYTLYLLNPNGIYKPLITVSPYYDPYMPVITRGLRTGETVRTIINASFPQSTTADLSLLAEIPPLDEIGFVSSDTTVLSFDADYNMIGHKEGTSIVTASYKDFSTYAITVTVGNMPTRILSYSPDKSIIPEFNVPTTPVVSVYPVGANQLKTWISSSTVPNKFTVNSSDNTVTYISTTSYDEVYTLTSSPNVFPTSINSSFNLVSPNAKTASISALSINSRKYSKPYALPHPLDVYYVGDVITVTSSARTSYGSIGEEYTLSVDKPNMIEPHKPYYMDSPINYMNETQIYKALEPGVCTITAFYPSINRSITLDIVVMEKPPVSPYPPSGN